MPELPEVETVRRQLETAIMGVSITEVEVLSDKQVDYNDYFAETLIGKTFSKIDRKGKFMFFSFKGQGDIYLISHLKMTGQLLYLSNNEFITGGGHSISEAALDLPNKHTRIIFYFSDGGTLFFNDLRKFGYIKIADKAMVNATQSKIGVEPIDPNFNCDDFYEMLQRTSVPIKVTLLDQKKIAGLGNIYVDEALWRSKIHPARPSNKVTKPEADKLCKSSRDVLNESIALGGTTFRDFRDSNSQSGNFKDYLQAFGKQGQPCKRCKDKIIKVKLRGRGTHFCPTCQI